MQSRYPDPGQRDGQAQPSDKLGLKHLKVVTDCGTVFLSLLGKSHQPSRRTDGISIHAAAHDSRYPCHS